MARLLILYSLFLLLNSFLYTCAQPSSIQEAEDPIILNTTFPDGELAALQEARPDSTLHGLSTYFYHDGNLKMKTQFRNGFREGRAETYHYTGELESIHHYKQGVPDGPYQWFYPEGALRQEGTYSNKQINGWVKNYFETGELRSTFHYQDGHRQGEGFEYFTDGRLRSYYGFEEGRRRFALRYDDFGQVEILKGDPLLQLEVDQSTLFQDNTLAVSISTALPPEWTGHIELKYQTSYGKAIDQIPVAAPNLHYRYRLPIPRQKAAQLHIQVSITNPATGETYSGQTQTINVDTEGQIELTYS